MERGLTVSRTNRSARVHVDSCTRTASRYANWYGMKVETKKSNTKVVVIRLLAELAAKDEATDLPLVLSVYETFRACSNSRT